MDTFLGFPLPPFTVLNIKSICLVIARPKFNLWLHIEPRLLFIHVTVCDHNMYCTLATVWIHQVPKMVAMTS